jgi:hypothetical protein
MWAHNLLALAQQCDEGELIFDPTREHAGYIQRSEDGTCEIDIEWRLILNPRLIAQREIAKIQAAVRKKAS